MYYVVKWYTIRINLTNLISNNLLISNKKNKDLSLKFYLE